MDIVGIVAPSPVSPVACYFMWIHLAYQACDQCQKPSCVVQIEGFRLNIFVSIEGSIGTPYIGKGSWDGNQF